MKEEYIAIVFLEKIKEQLGAYMQCEESMQG
jgi:hypothetical protein